jgi:hypothetical protein
MLLWLLWLLAALCQYSRVPGRLSVAPSLC